MALTVSAFPKPRGGMVEIGDGLFVDIAEARMIASRYTLAADQASRQVHDHAALMDKPKKPGGPDSLPDGFDIRQAGDQELADRLSRKAGV